MINLGKAIYTLISGSCYSLVSNKIYPLEIPEGVTLPIIVYERSSSVEYTRDGTSTYISIVTIYVLTNKYSDGIDIGALIINSLNNYKGQVQGINIQEIRLSGIEETVTDQIFTQKLDFNVRNF